MNSRIPIRVLTIAVVVILAATGSRANAAFLLTLQQTGGNVVGTGSGSFNLAALTSVTSLAQGPFVDASAGDILLALTATAQATFFDGITGPSSFGSGGDQGNDTGVGNVVGIEQGFYLLVPSGYTSGILLSGTDTWSGSTLSSLGVTPGTFEWTWGSGATADSFTLVATAGAVPEPSTWAMLAAGIGSLLLFRRGRSWT
jgi:hypothetical protein